MPTPLSKRDWKHEWQLDKKTGKNKDDLERAKARRLIDNAGIDRKGKHVGHKVALSKGGKSTLSNLVIQDPKENMSIKRGSNHKVVSEISDKERRKKK